MMKKKEWKGKKKELHSYDKHINWPLNNYSGIWLNAACQGAPSLETDRKVQDASV